ncbi:hypothetical protein T02_7334 [Trichinella nativa]|uniref:Uncharacterized protein n=1 Tax=Trichinella nativa TaxID=6335 RepID=A0A0V1KW87_9BILA|nr:hypothetical protein T02_7334 [Trichinella nativa]
MKLTHFSNGSIPDALKVDENCNTSLPVVSCRNFRVVAAGNSSLKNCHLYKHMMTILIANLPLQLVD